MRVLRIFILCGKEVEKVILYSRRQFSSSLTHSYEGFFTYLIRIRFAVTACTESGYYVFFLNSFLRKENNFQLGSSLFPGLSFDNSISIFLCLHRKRRMWHLVGDSLEVFAFGAHAY